VHESNDHSNGLEISKSGDFRSGHDGGWKMTPQEIKNGRPRFSRDLPSLEFQIDRCNYHCMDSQKANPRTWRVSGVFDDFARNRKRTNYPAGD
jgi:hypothetical protein